MWSRISLLLDLMIYNRKIIWSLNLLIWIIWCIIIASDVSYIWDVAITILHYLDSVMSNRASPSYYVTMAKVVVITHPLSLYLICKCNANWKDVLQLLYFIVHEQIKGVHSLLCLAWRRMILYCWLCVRMVKASGVPDEKPWFPSH